MPKLKIESTRIQRDAETLSASGFPKVTILSPVLTYIDHQDADNIKPLLEYNETIYMKTRNMIQKRVVQKHFVLNSDSAKKLGADPDMYFKDICVLTGLLGRLKAHFPYMTTEIASGANISLCADNIMDARVSSHIQLRPDQISAIENVKKNHRGIIVAPTGTGKTVIISGIVSCYRKFNILILAHTIDLVSQIADEIKKITKLKVQLLGGGNQIDWSVFEINKSTIDDKTNTIPDGNIIVSTIQSFSSLEIDQYKDLFDVVIIDEVHHVNKIDGMYGKVLLNLMAPVRIGFTATMPQEKKSLLCMEGLLGNVINQLSLDDAKEKGLIVAPKIHLHKLAYNQKINDIKNYKQVVNEAITKGFALNNKIAEISANCLDKKQNILIFVQFIEQGEYIQALLQRKEIEADFVNGEMEPLVREEIKKRVENTKGNIVITTTVWKEGINIPSLDGVVLGGGWRSYIPIIQAIGRGLRTFEDKTEMTVHDFFDPSHTSLVSQFGDRLCLYFEMGWI